MNMKKVKEKLSSPWVAVNLLLLIAFLALVTLHIKISIDMKPEPPLESHEPEPLTREKSVQTSDSSQKDPSQVCKSPECITLAHQLLNYQDPSVDPCQDFYQHSCGRFYEHSTLFSTNEEKSNNLYKLIRGFLLKNKTTTSKSENAMKLVYDKCRELQKSSSLDIIPQQALQDIFNDIKKIGAWPVLEKDWDGSNFDLNEMLRKLVKLGESNLGLFQFTFTNAAEIRIDTATSQLDDSSLLKKTILKIFEENGVEPDLERLSTDLLEYSNLEEKLKPMLMLVGERDNLLPDVQSVNFTSLVEQMIHPNRASKLLGKITPKISTVKHSLLIRSNETEHLDTIIKSTPNRTLANFLIFNFIQSSINRLILPPTEYDACEYRVIAELPLASLRVFVRYYVDKGNREEVRKMTELLRKNILEMIRETETFTPPVKERLLKKVGAIRAMIGYPDHFDPPGTLDKEFDNLDLDASDSYYKTLQKLRKLRYQRQMEFIAGESPISTLSNFFLVNAVYYYDTNGLVVLAPYFDDPFFDLTYPEYVNLFSLGFTIGHEFGHAIDPKMLSTEDWYKREDMTEYKKRYECLIDQYNNHDEPDFGKVLNGTHAIGENFADWIGHEVIWRVFKKMDVSRMQKLTGLENTSLEQLYFRIHSLTYCNPRGMNGMFLNDVHGTSSFRVNGAYSNMPEFAKAFNCPIGSPMNPEKKCKML